MSGDAIEGAASTVGHAGTFADTVEATAATIDAAKGVGGHGAPGGALGPVLGKALTVLGGVGGAINLGLGGADIIANGAGVKNVGQTTEGALGSASVVAGAAGSTAAAAALGGAAAGVGAVLYGDEASKKNETTQSVINAVGLANRDANGNALPTSPIDALANAARENSASAGGGALGALAGAGTILAGAPLTTAATLANAGVGAAGAAVDGVTAAGRGIASLGGRALNAAGGALSSLFGGGSEAAQ